MAKRRSIIASLGAALAVTSTALPVHAQGTDTPATPTKSVTLSRCEHPPVIDGRLDDACWVGASRFDDFTQVDPAEGRPPTERTEVLVCLDGHSLLVGVRCFDSEPAGVIGKQRQRDGNLDGDDTVILVLDPFDDQRNGYVFQLGAAGAKLDGLVENGRNLNALWDGIWYGKASRTPEGWAAEFAVPFKTVSFTDGAASWGFNVQRVIRRKQETVRWSGATQSTLVRDLAAAGKLTGLDGMERGVGLTLKPFLAGRVDLDDGGTELKPGLDLFMRITPSTTAALTLNTDFAEAEVDDRRVNLTRFPLFFPEKREFFLQDAALFNFGGIRRSPLPFYSRRIGLVNGEPKEILAGVKVTGREGGVGFGLLDVQMGNDGERGSKNLGVARITGDVFEESTVGFIATNGDPATNDDNTLAGADFNYRTSKLPGGKIFEAGVWVQGTHSAGVDGHRDDTAFGGRISYPNDDWSFSLFAAQFGKDFNPALGFVERAGSREYNAFLRYRWRPGGWVRRVDVSADASVFTDLNSAVDTSDAGLPQIEIENRHGDRAGANLSFVRERLTDPFEISDGVTIAPGTYDFSRGEVYFTTAIARPVALRGRFSPGGFYDGRREDYLIAAELRPSPSFFGSLEYEFNDVHLPSGDFVVRIVRARANVFFTPEISWSNSVQYDSVSDLAGVNSRVRWEFVPGDDVYVVFNHGYAVGDGVFRTASSSITVKLGVTFRF